MENIKIMDEKLQSLKSGKLPWWEEREESLIHCDGGLNGGCMESLKDGNLTSIVYTYETKKSNFMRDFAHYACNKHLDDFITLKEGQKC